MTAVKWAEGKHIRQKVCRNGQGGRELKCYVKMERYSPHTGDLFFYVCTFYTYKNAVPDLDRNPFGFGSGGKMLSFPHTPPVCGWVCTCLWLQGFMCFLYNVVSFSLRENATRVLKKNTGFVVAALKKVKSLSRREQSVRAHKYSCGHATDGCFSIEPQFETECSSRPETFRAPPMGGFLYHLAGDPEHLYGPRAEGISPQRAMLANSEL